MMQPLASIELNGPVLLLKMLSNGALSAVDAESTLFFIHPQTSEVIGGCKPAVPQERLWGNHVDIGPYAQVFAAVVPRTNKAVLYAVKKKRVLHEFGRHQGQVESVAVDPQTRYLVTGGEDGKTFVWDMQSAALAFTLPQHMDHVTAIAFEAEGCLIATGSYDKMIHVVTFENTKHPLRLSGHASAVVKLMFVGENRLISAGKKGELFVWDLRNGKVQRSLESADSEITALCLCDARRYLFVGTKSGAVRLYDLSINKLLSADYLKMKSTVTALAYIGETQRLCVGTLKGVVDIYALLGDEERLQELIDTHAYAEFYKAVEENVMLRTSERYKRLEMNWKRVADKAAGLLENGEIALAKVALGAFSDVRCKKGLINKMLRYGELLAEFKVHVEQRRYALAYAVAAKTPEIKQTGLYRMMEATWEKALMRARKLAGDKRGEEEAKALLAPYRGISDKTVRIQQVIHEGRHYVYFKELIGKHDWKRVFELLKQHPFLQETKECASLDKYADTLFIEASKAYENGQMAKARQLCEILGDFPDFKTDAREMLDAIRGSCGP